MVHNLTGKTSVGLHGFSTCSSYNASDLGDGVCILDLGGAAYACFLLEVSQASAAVASGGCARADASSKHCDSGRHFCRVDDLATAAETGGRSRADPALRAGPVEPRSFFVLNLPSSSARLARMRAQFEALRLPPL